MVTTTKNNTITKSLTQPNPTLPKPKLHTFQTTLITLNKTIRPNHLPPSINHRLPTPTLGHRILPIRITLPSNSPIRLHLNKLILKGCPHRQRHSNRPLRITRRIIIRGHLHRITRIPVPKLGDRSAQVDFLPVGSRDELFERDREGGRGSCACRRRRRG